MCTVSILELALRTLFTVRLQSSRSTYACFFLSLAVSFFPPKGCLSPQDIQRGMKNLHGAFARHLTGASNVIVMSRKLQRGMFTHANDAVSPYQGSVSAVNTLTSTDLLIAGFHLLHQHVIRIRLHTVT